MAVLRKLGKRTGKTQRAQKVTGKTIRRPAKILQGGSQIKPAAAAAGKKPAAAQDLIIEKEKFNYPPRAIPVSARPMPQDLPGHYGANRIVLQVRDPWWLHTWWEASGELFEQVRQRFGREFQKARRVLRVYDVTNVNFNGSNAAGFFDIDINDYAQSWYISAGPGRAWCVDLGILLADGRFIMLLRSNIVSTPLEGPSSITDEEWMVPEEMFTRLYGMGEGFGRASPGKGWQARFPWATVSSRIGSGSMSSPVRQKR